MTALHTLVQFELAQAGGEVALAATLCAGAQRQANASAQLCGAAMQEMRVVQARAAINPALVTAVHRMLGAQQEALRDSQTRLRESSEREQQARAALAEVRNLDRSVERALKSARSDQQLGLQARQSALADDMWLQQQWRDAQ
ncbi:MAG: hypothetical protein ABI605_03610 [Rhizobacter sp.]